MFVRVCVLAVTALSRERTSPDPGRAGLSVLRAYAATSRVDFANGDTGRLLTRKTTIRQEGETRAPFFVFIYIYVYLCVFVCGFNRPNFTECTLYTRQRASFLCNKHLVYLFFRVIAVSKLEPAA